MTVPVHNLYDFVHQVTKNKYLLYYFYPWGFKDLKNIAPYQIHNNWLFGPRGIPESDLHQSSIKQLIDDQLIWAIWTQPTMFCHDQEPLNFSLYADETDCAKKRYRDWGQEIGLESMPDCNANLRLASPFSLQKTWTLLHSELNSQELTKYEETGKFYGAYWWSHAVIARDWYRFAEYDTALKPSTEYKKIFLCYCRDTSGSRHYRQDFLNLISHYNLQQQCQTKSFNTDSIVNSDASAIYEVEDFNNTAISIVLETVFDQRIHLTEKILRAIACGHPFILAAGPGSLKLLKSYGFHTFQGYINEEYDDIIDSSDRLKAIVKEMKRIEKMPEDQRNNLIESLREIAAYNQERFFSKSFHQQVVDQLEQNVALAFSKHKGELDLEIWWQTRCLRRAALGNKFHQIKKTLRSNPLLLLYRQHRLSQRANREQ